MTPEGIAGLELRSELCNKEAHARRAMANETIELAPGITLSSGATEMTAVASGGPGGQNVNKVASKVQLRVDLSKIVGLAEDANARLLKACSNKLDKEGQLLLFSQETRDQRRNLEACIEKLRDLVRAAMVRPKKRKKTKPSKRVIERRLQSKREVKEKKAGRKLPKE